MDQVEKLERRVKALEQELREIKLSMRNKTIGTNQVPIREFFLSDTRTGTVAVVDYDSGTGALRVTKAR